MLVPTGANTSKLSNFQEKDEDDSFDLDDRDIDVAVLEENKSKVWVRSLPAAECLLCSLTIQ